MGLAPYIGKAALSAAEILSGVSPQLFQEMLAPICVGVAVDEAVEQTFECQVLSEMLVNLLARLYPRLLILAPVSRADSLKALATSINPNIELLDQGAPTVWVNIGDCRCGTSDRSVIYASSDGWTARISEGPAACGKTNNPIGAAAACLAAANVFRAVFSEQLSGAPLDRDLSLCLFDYKVNDPSCASCHGIYSKSRRKVLYGQLRKHLCEVLHKLADQKESRIEEGHLLSDHVHMLISTPPKYAVSQVVGVIKGKS